MDFGSVRRRMSFRTSAAFRGIADMFPLLGEMASHRDFHAQPPQASTCYDHRPWGYGPGRAEAAFRPRTRRTITAPAVHPRGGIR